MWKRTDERWGVAALWTLIVLGVLDRLHLLVVFGFRYIGIDDALIQQVAVDYGNGVFREPYLYGQNYNPMLEALLAAPFVRLGLPPWIVLPVVTSVLALLPFWSFAWWCLRKGRVPAAWAFALLPLLLPVEWGMMTSMSRGFVHGIALLAFIPWLGQLKNALLRHATTGLALAAALLCNPNTLPLVAGIAAWLIAQYARSIRFWVINALVGALALGLHWSAQAHFDAVPLMHPLTAQDLRPSADLLWTGLTHLDEHFLHVNPFGGMALLVLLGLVLDAFTNWRSGHRAEAAALVTSLLVLVGALSVVKVHEGCASVFFPKSRMFLSLPLIIGVAALFTLDRFKQWKGWVPAAIAVVGLVLLGMKVNDTEIVVARELASQSCAYVREEPISEIRTRCQRIKDEAIKTEATLVVPIRWPGIRMDHAAHFQAHFTCYACEQLVPDFPPTYGAGFDRRNWRAGTYERVPGERVLFVGGDPAAWATGPTTGSQPASSPSVQLHGVQMDSTSISAFILKIGADDDLGR